MKFMTKNIFASLGLIVGMMLSSFGGANVLALPQAIDGGVPAGVEAARGANQPSELFGDQGIFQRITNILLFLIGVLSVIMLIVGGLRYVLSGGNQQAVGAAKNTILYAIAGLIIAILSYAIINFVMTTFTGGAGYSGGIDA